MWRLCDPLDPGQAGGGPAPPRPPLVARAASGSVPACHRRGASDKVLPAVNRLVRLPGPMGVVRVPGGVPALWPDVFEGEPSAPSVAVSAQEPRPGRAKLTPPSCPAWLPPIARACCRPPRLAAPGVRGAKGRGGLRGALETADRRPWRGPGGCLGVAMPVERVPPRDPPAATCTQSGQQGAETGSPAPVPRRAVVGAPAGGAEPVRNGQNELPAPWRVIAAGKRNPEATETHGRRLGPPPARRARAGRRVVMRGRAHGGTGAVRPRLWTRAGKTRCTADRGAPMPQGDAAGSPGRAVLAKGSATRRRYREWRPGTRVCPGSATP